jgi:hypothetical protein
MSDHTPPQKQPPVEEEEKSPSQDGTLIEDDGGKTNQDIGKTEHDSSRDFGWGMQPFGEEAMQDIQKEGTEEVVFGEESNLSRFLPSGLKKRFDTTGKIAVTPLMDRLHKMASDTVTKSRNMFRVFGERLFLSRMTMKFT